MRMGKGGGRGEADSGKGKRGNWRKLESGNRYVENIREG
jgi:hypothetical protein